MADVRLDTDKVIIEENLYVEGPDIRLDYPSRRADDNLSAERRALVHGSNDDLILNFSNDYKSVTINARDGSAITLNGGQIRLNGETHISNLNDAWDVATILNILLEERRLYQLAIRRIEEHLNLSPSPIVSESAIPVIPGIDADIEIPFNPRIPQED